MARIIVKLLSDLCLGSGQSMSSVVDTEICFDAEGYPCFPARRLKGCLRAAALQAGFSEAQIRGLFGSGAENGSIAAAGALWLQNGTLVDREQYADKLSGCTPTQVSEAFASVRGRTAIDEETGVAKDETLHTVRVLHPRVTGMNAPVSFEFKAFAPAEQDALLKACCRALRHVGLDRNRGLGWVDCSYEPDIPADNAKAQPPEKAPENAEDCYMRLRLHLEEPLQMASSSNEQSLSYVPGGAVLGAFANLYLRKYGEADAVFDEIFLKGRVRFDPLYISDAEGTECVPAPRFLQKLKSSECAFDGRLVTVFTGKIDGRPVTDFQRKPIRDDMADREMHIRKVHMEIIPHVNRGQKLLYTQTAISAGQYFTGCVEGPRAYLEILKLLARGGLRLGRSKTAQYSHCALVDEPEMKINPMPAADVYALQAGETVLFALESDVLREEGQSGAEALLKLLLPEGLYEMDSRGCSLGYRDISGYNAKRGLRNLPRSAYAAGSVVCAKLTAAQTLRVSRRIGRGQSEGFGMVRLYRMEEILNFALTGNSSDSDGETPEMGEALRWFHQNGQDFASREGMTASFVGRLIQMVGESADIQEVEARFNSIKINLDNAGRRDAALELLHSAPEGASFETQRKWLTDVLTLIRPLMKATSASGEAERGREA